MRDQANTSQVSPTSSHDQVANIKFDGVHDLAGSYVDLDGIIDIDLRVRVANGSAIVCDAVRDALPAKSYPLHFSKFVL